MKSLLSPQLGLLAATLLEASLAQAQIPMVWEPFERTGKVEFYGLGQYLSSDDIKFSTPDGTVRVEMDDTGLGGLGMAYHFHDLFSIKLDLMFGGATFRAENGTWPYGNVQSDGFLHTGRFNVEYNIITRRFTPFATAGIGYQYFSVELEHHPPVQTCWYDPWYGEECSYDEPEYTESDFSWNVGAGFRWTVTDNIFLKASVGANWLQYDEADGTTPDRAWRSFDKLRAMAPYLFQMRAAFKADWPAPTMVEAC